MNISLDFFASFWQKQYRPMKQAYRFLLILLICMISFTGYVEATYRQVYTATDNGGLSWTGNTLGLSKATNQNQPGTVGAIGAFITLNTSLKVGNYPSGTTLNYTLNSSAAVLDIPAGSTILHAELIWGGSYGYGSGISNTNMIPIQFITPDNVSHTVTPKAATAQSLVFGAQGGAYVRSADVTSLVTGGGTYAAAAVPGTVTASQNTANCAGWTLAVAYRNPNMLTSNLNLYVSCELSGAAAVQVSNFKAPTAGTITSRLFAMGIEGDAEGSGDQLLVGPTSSLNSSNAVSGTNNPVNNFFCSQINTLLPLTTNPDGKLVAIGSSQLDQRGTFGTRNANAGTSTPISGGRQGWDITSVDISNKISYGQTTLFVRGTTGGESYVIGGLGIQIQVSAPIINAQLAADRTTVTSLNDLITYTATFTNTSDVAASSVTFNDNLPLGLTFVPGTFTVDGNPSAAANLQNAPIGNINPGATRTISFQAQVTQINPPTSYDNFATVTYSNSAVQVPTSLTSSTNTLTITYSIPPAPIANDDTATTSANTTLNETSVLANDIGTDISIFSYQSTSAAGGSVLMPADGTYTYMPPFNFSGTDTFTYSIMDSFNRIAGPATVTITVMPVATNDSQASVAANTPLNQMTSVLSNDIGTNLSIISAQNPSNEGGTVLMNSNGTYIYNPPQNFSGIDTFNYTLQDQAGNTAIGTVTITVLPEAKDDVGITPANTPLIGSTLFTNDAGQGLILVSYDMTSANGGHIVMDMVDGTYLYTPPLNFSGIDTFTYTVEDQAGNTSTATVTITVTPIARSDSTSTPINQTLNQIFSVLNNDTGSNLFILSYDHTSIQGGKVQMKTNGEYVYIPPHNFAGSDSFVYTLSDPTGNIKSATVKITVTNVFPNDSFITQANTTLIGSSVLSNDPSVGLEVVDFQNPSNQGGFVSVNANGTFIYMPPLNFSGVDSFLYLATDANNQMYSATVTITVLPLIQPSTYITAINTQLVGSSVLANDIGTNLRVTAFQNPSNAGGAVAMNPDGTFIYDPPLNFVGEDSFTYTATDDAGNSVQGTVFIMVIGVPPPPPPPPPQQGPTLISIDPSSGPEAGGTLVFITGTNFIEGNTQVFFGEKPALNVVVSSPNSLIVTTPPGTGVVDVIIKTPFGSSPVVPADQYTYIRTPPPPPPIEVLPPRHFQGVIKKYEFLNRTDYELKASWKASKSPDVVAYRIYYRRKLVEQVSAKEPLKIKLSLQHRQKAKKFSVTAVDANGNESTATQLRIKSCN